MNQSSPLSIVQKCFAEEQRDPATVAELLAFIFVANMPTSIAPPGGAQMIYWARTKTNINNQSLKLKSAEN